MLLGKYALVPEGRIQAAVIILPGGGDFALHVRFDSDFLRAHWFRGASEKSENEIFIRSCGATACSPPKTCGGRRPIDPIDVLQKMHDGTLHIPGAVVTADGWLRVSQSALSVMIGTSKTTVCNRIAELEATGRLVKKTDGHGTYWFIRAFLP